MRSQHTQPPGNIAHGDAYSIGQLAQMWEKPSIFVRGLITRDLLATDEGGLVTNDELRRFYADSGDLLNP